MPFEDKIVLEVTQKHINAGKRLSCTECPIALAFEEMCGRRPFVSPTGLKFYKVSGRNTISWYYSLPQEAINFIKTFDWESRKPSPITFTITKVSETGTPIND